MQNAWRLLCLIGALDPPAPGGVVAACATVSPRASFGHAHRFTWPSKCQPLRDLGCSREGSENYVIQPSTFSRRHWKSEKALSIQCPWIGMGISASNERKNNGMDACQNPLARLRPALVSLDAKLRRTRKGTNLPNWQCFVGNQGITDLLAAVGHRYLWLIWPSFSSRMTLILRKPSQGTAGK